jgi:CRP/FNR family cyclic AMP-dependent transcriptional regulator
MRRRVSLKEQLGKVPLFENLSEPDLAHVARLAVRVREPKGEMLTKEGEPGHEFLIVLEGEVEIRHGDQVIRTLGPGAYLGEVALLDDRSRRTATVVAQTPVAIAFIGRQEFNRLLSDLPELAQQIRDTMVRRGEDDNRPPE